MLRSQIALVPFEKTGDPFILTREKLAGPFSFVDVKGKKYCEKKPAPVYMPLSDLNFKRDQDKESLFEFFDIQKNGELKLNDIELQERQKGVFYDIIKNLGSKMLSGKSIVGFSLPIRIFEPRSTIERVIDGF